jgi:hypothetical protein
VIIILLQAYHVLLTSTDWGIPPQKAQEKDCSEIVSVRNRKCAFPQNYFIEIKCDL